MDNSINIKEIVNVRFQNPKFVYDGKRVQPVYDRKSYDYSSALIYETQIPLIEPFLDQKYNLGSQILSMKAPDRCTAHEAVTSHFVHMCINKIRSPVNVIQWTPNGRRLLSGSSSGEITMWNGFSFNFDTILQAHESPIRAMCWARSSSFLITGDNMGIIKYWHPSMNNIQVIHGHDEGIKDLSFSYNDTKFCSASDDATIKIWDSVKSKCERVLTGHNWDIRKAQWHEEKALIASGGKDNLLKLWDPRVNECLTTFHYHKNTILSLKFYKNDYLLTGGKDQIIKMLDLRTMKEIFTYKNLGKDVTALSIHPFSEMFVTGNNDGTILFWDMMVDEPIAVSNEKHDNTIWSLDFHPAGHVLASGAADFMVKYWVRPRPGDDKAEEENQELIEQDVEESYESKIPGIF